jgi:hypothetical protein
MFGHVHDFSPKLDCLLVCTDSIYEFSPYVQLSPCQTCLQSHPSFFHQHLHQFFPQCSGLSHAWQQQPHCRRSLLQEFLPCLLSHPQPHHSLFYTPLGCAGGLFARNFNSTLFWQPTWQPCTHECLVCKCTIALGHTIEHTTKSSYNSGTNSYLTFCKVHHRPIAPVLKNLNIFTIFMCHHINPKSVDNYLSGVCNNLKGYFPNAHATQNSALVSCTLAGCKWLYDCPAHRKCALTREDLLTVSNDLAHSTSHDDLLFLTQLLSGITAVFIRLRNRVESFFAYPKSPRHI